MRPVRRRVLWAGIVVGIAIALVPGTALAVFSATPAVTAGVTAATISAPGGFAATAASTTTVNLSWTAPPALTGYTLAQSPGTLAGCSAAPSGTSCTATGLAPNSAHTWTLKAAYNNWLSSSVQASATTVSTVGFTLAGKAADGTGGTSSSTATRVTTTSGAGLVILIFRQASSAALGITSVSGSAINGTATAITSQASDAIGNFEVAAYRATGTGTSNGTVTVSFSASNNVNTTIDVVQLSGNNTATPIVQSAASSSPSSGATVTGAALPGASASDGELFFAVLTTTTSMSTPAGYTVLDVPASTVHGVWGSSSASTAGITTNLGGSSYWGTIEIEISHG